MSALKLFYTHQIPRYTQPPLLPGWRPKTPREKRKSANNWPPPPPNTIFKYLFNVCLLFEEAERLELLLFFLRQLPEHSAVWLKDLLELSNDLDAPVYCRVRVLLLLGRLGEYVKQREARDECNAVANKGQISSVQHHRTIYKNLVDIWWYCSGKIN